MIVGFLKVRTALSALAKRGVAPGAGDGAVGGSHVVSGGGAPVVVKAPEVVGTTAIKKDSVDEPEQVSSSPSHVAGVLPATPAPVASVPASAPHFNGGKFKADFSDGGKSVAGQAGIFKSTSGWQDGKYYALINNVSVGTIVKITDQATGKSVYAKVLGQLPEMKESAGLTIRVSNAAAAELGEGDGKFGVGVSY
jgi:hypothetical protein